MSEEFLEAFNKLYMIEGVRDDLWLSAWAWDHKNLKSFIGSKHERSSIWVYTRVV
jgi:hypothetical protein